MLKKISLRLRLTLLSAMIIISVAVILTAISIISANYFFVGNVQQSLADNILFSSKEGDNPATEAGRSHSASVTPEDSAVNDPADDGYISEGLISVEVAFARGRQRFNLWGIAGMALITLLGVGATWLMAGRALKPVRELSSAIREVSGKDLSRRVDIRGRQDEIGQLARAFNGMMDKVSASFERQKRFSASAAHELRTPLATIQVGLEVLELDDDPDRMKKALTVTKLNTDRMIRLMNDLFRLSADEGYEMEEEMPAGELFAEILEELSPLTQKKRLSVSMTAAPDAGLTGSRTLLYRALFNLTENAVKYNREGGSVSLEAKREDNSVIIRITDTGIGIPDEELERIFEPFYRVDRSRSRTMGGSGLGLSLVKDIIEKHNGSVEVESRMGEGTAFTLQFPSVPPEQPHGLRDGVIEE